MLHFYAESPVIALKYCQHGVCAILRSGAH